MSDDDYFDSDDFDEYDDDYYYESSADYMPQDLSEEQFAWAMEFIEDMREEGYDWEDIWDILMDDFWDWYDEQYGEQ